MPHFSEASLVKLRMCDDRLRLIATKAIRRVDFTIVHGFRNNALQQDLYDQGLSKKLPGRSKHNLSPAMAFDFAPYPIDWKNEERFILVAGILIGIGWELGIGLRWGGDWDSDGDTSDQSFMDYGHIEII